MITLSGTSVAIIHRTAQVLIAWRINVTLSGLLEMSPVLLQSTSKRLLLTSIFLKFYLVFFQVKGITHHLVIVRDERAKYADDW